MPLATPSLLIIFAYLVARSEFLCYSCYFSRPSIPLGGDCFTRYSATRLEGDDDSTCQ